MTSSSPMDHGGCLSADTTRTGGQRVLPAASDIRKTGIDLRNMAQPVRRHAQYPNLDRGVPPSLELMAAQIGGYSRLSTDQSSSRRVIRFQAGLLRYRRLRMSSSLVGFRPIRPSRVTIMRAREDR